MPRQTIGLSLCLVIAFGVLTPVSAVPTFKQREAAQKVADAITAAGRLYQQGKYKDSADAVRSAQGEFEKLATDADAGFLKMLGTIHKRLKTAHGLLELEGYKLPPVNLPTPGTKPDTPSTPPKPTGVSFVSQVAPILNGRCGGCHIRKASGKFSMASYELLMKGPTAGLVVFPGDPAGSRLVEAIEGGEMPPNGNGIPADQLATIKKWIMEGAKFDGNDAGLDLARLQPASTTPAPSPTKPTGNETVSFAQHIAPMLVENCSGCHVNAQRVRGGLNMTTFQRLLRGGDSGEIFVARNPANSLLIAKLKGTGDGQRMPAGGKPPLSADAIAVVEKWIAEGAKFDGPNPNEVMDKVAALAKAENSSHDELSADRAKKAREYWRLGMPGIEANVVETENYLVVGNMGENSLKAAADVAEQVAPKVAQILGHPSTQPLIKGRFTLFLFQTRYDYSEFGNMVEKRQLPKGSRGHWRFSVVDAYGALIPSRTDEYTLDGLIGKQLAGAYIASMGKLPPRWFSEGTARVLASRLVADDPRIVDWDEQVPKIVAEMSKPDDFLTGQLAPESSDIASYSFVKSLMKNSKSFNKLLSALRRGEEFNKSFSQAYGGSPAQLAGAWSRSAAKAKPIRRR